MMNRAVVLVVSLGALGAAYAMYEFVEKGAPPIQRTWLPDTLGSRGAAQPAAAAAPAAPDAATPPASPGAKPAATDPAKPGAATPAKPEPPKPEPPKPPPPRTVDDLKLVVVRNAQDLALPKVIEVHAVITPEDEYLLTWYGADRKTKPYKDTKNLGNHLRSQEGSQFVLVPADNLPWFRIRELIKCAQDNYGADMWLGVAKEGDPATLRVLPFRQCARSDEEMPSGFTFHVNVENSSGTPAISIEGRKLASFPADLAAAWNEWKKAHADVADTSVPERTHVVLEAPKGASFAHVVQVIDVLRGLGIQTERIAGAASTRPVR